MAQASIQQKIYIQDIQDGVIMLNSGVDFRAVLMTTTTNFALKSTQEQDALIIKYQFFLNSLDFPVQILVLSRRLDISVYLANLEQKKKEQPNELLKIQISEYVDFIKNLVQVSNIMNQNFFVIVPISQAEKKEAGFMNKLSFLSKKNKQEEKKSSDELKAQLWQRVEYVASGLAGIGLKAVPLNTQEITEIFYHLYNMGLEEKPTFPVPEKKEEESEKKPEK